MAGGACMFGITTVMLVVVGYYCFFFVDVGAVTEGFPVQHMFNNHDRGCGVDVRRGPVN